jgi:putative selenium metabolism protein SsnA
MPVDRGCGEWPSPPPGEAQRLEVGGKTRPQSPAGPPAPSAVLTGADVLTSLDPPQVVRADIVISGGRITAGPAPGAEPAGGARLDCSGCLIVPGSVCAHTHLYSTLARGMPGGSAPPRSFVEILRSVWWRLDRALDEASIQASALAGGLAALLAGTTTLVDHHASPNAIDGSLDVIAGTLGELGLRSVLCYEVTDRDGPARAQAGLAENQRFLKRAADAYPLARGMVGAHASFTLSEQTLAACVDLADTAHAGIHIHVAEDGTDSADARARFGTGVADRLAAAGLLDKRALLAHCVRLDPEETAIINTSGAAVAHNCRSNLNNGVGRAPVRDLHRLALGTDGIDADMFAESRAAFFRLREDDVTASPGWPIVRLAEGARFAGAAFGEPSLGTIEPGAPADLVVLRYTPPTPLSSANAPGHWAFGLHAGLVRDVFVAGERVVADGVPTRVDAERAAARSRPVAAALWQRMAEFGTHPFLPACAASAAAGSGVTAAESRGL